MHLHPVGQDVAFIFYLELYNLRDNPAASNIVHYPAADILAQLYETMTDGVVGYDPSGVIVFCNPGMCLITGRSLEEILGRTSDEAFGLTINFPDSMLSSQMQEQSIRRPNGQVRYLSVKTFSLKGTQPLRIAIYRDITRSRNTVEALRRVEECHNEVMRAHALLLWTTDAAMVVTGALGAGYEPLRLRPTDLAGQPLAEVLRAGDPSHPALRATRDALGGESRRVEFELAGRVIDLQVVPQRDGNGVICGTLATGADVTEARRSREAADTATREYRQLFNESLTPHFVASPTGRLLNANRQFLRLFGCMGMEDARRVVALDSWITAGGENCLALLQRERAVERLEVVAQRRNGAPVHLEVTASARFDDDGMLMMAQGTVLDLTARRRLERSLARGDAQLRAVLGATGTALLHVSAEGRILDVRAEGMPALAKLTTVLSGRDLAEFMAPAAFAVMAGALARVAESGEEELLTTALGPAENALPFEFIVRRIATDELAIILAPIGPTGTTRSRRHTTPLIGPIAHQLNNHLMAVIGHLSLVAMDLPEGQPGATSLAEAQSEALKAADFVTRLLARRSGNSIVTRGWFEQLAHDLTVQPAYHPEAGPLLIICTPPAEPPPAVTLSCETLATLVRHVAVAIRPGPQRAPMRLSVASRALGAEDASGWLGAEIRPEVEGAILQLKGPDLGPAAPDRPAPGLGRLEGAAELATAIGLLRSVHGLMRWTGEGAEGMVEIFLPAAAGTPDAAGMESSKGAMQRRVLLHEPDPDLLTLVAEQLRQLGLEVQVTATVEAGERAIRQAATEGTLALAIIDTSLGAEVAMLARQALPELPLVLLTGLTAKATPPEGPQVRHLSKPFLLARLRQLILECLPTQPTVGIGANR
jgi:PAS domain S-box-containing protein